MSAFCPCLDGDRLQLSPRWNAKNRPCIQIGSFNCPVEYEEEMHAGYVTSRMPAHCATASCVRTRKLNSVAGWAKHMILYEYTSLDGFNRDYEAANSKSPLGVGGHSIVPYLVHA